MITDQGRDNFILNILTKGLVQKIWESKRSKISVGNYGHPKTSDTWYISAMGKSFGWKIWVLKHLPLGYIHTKN